MYRIAPAVSITRLAEGDLTFPEGDDSRFFLKVDTIPSINVVSRLYRLLPIILKSRSYKFCTLTFQYLHKVVAFSINLIQNIKFLKWCGYIFLKAL
jgi:hypothetical protein